MAVRWLTAFIDRPAGSFDSSARFWAVVTGSTLSTARGDADEFATLLPLDGDPYLRMQRIADGHPGSHLDVHVEDVDEFTAHALAAGASVHQRHDTFMVMCSPAGLPWCVVPFAGETARPQPRPAGDPGVLHLFDQLCIDIPASRFDEESAFWSRVTGWELRHSSQRPEFSHLVRPDWCPLRLLLQRCDDDGPARAHLDLSSSDVERVVAHHAALGARMTAVFEHWTVMADPAGAPYCITTRDPATGSLATPS